MGFPLELCYEEDQKEWKCIVPLYPKSHAAEIEAN